MAQSIILSGPQVALYINNKLFKTVQSINFTVDYGEEGIFGIDSPYAQDIAITKVTITGSVRGIRIKNSGGLQGQNLRPLFQDMAAAPYISIRIHDITNGEDIILIPQAKVTRESHSAQTKRVYTLDFDFMGIVPLFALDRSS